MIRYYVICIFSLVMQAAAAQKINFSGSVQFVSEAPLEIIRAESKKLRGALDPASRSFAFSVELKTLDGFNSSLQKEHFHENYMETAKFPSITYAGKMLDVIPLDKDGVYTCRTKGMFTIRGQARERIINNTITVKGGYISIESQFFILLSDHQITIPKIVHKKIAEEIRVQVRANSVRI